MAEPTQPNVASVDDETAPDASMPTPRERRSRQGREVRTTVPRSSLGEWEPAPGRDPNALLAAQDETRDQGLVPLRHERMGVSPFTYYRGAAAVFSADMADMPRTGLDVQLCGDAHLANFGAFASPDRTLVFDLNDFDETLPGPFEWDLRRLVASFEVAARHRSFDEPTRVQVVTDCVLSYIRAMRELSKMTNLDVWYSRITVEELAQRWGQSASKAMLRRFQRTVDKAKSKDRMRAFEKLVTVESGQARFRSDPPVLVPVRDLIGVEDGDVIWNTVSLALESYKETLAPDRQVLIDRCRFVDLARKVVGVGSVGTRCWVALLVGDDDTDPLFIQVKEAQASVMEPYLGASTYGQHGQRVVEGQRLIQSAPDMFLGWERIVGFDGGERDYYFRQLWDWKGSADLESMTAASLTMYGAICGWTLAQAHARTGDRVAISAYLGGGRTAVASLLEFATRYADQTEADHRAFV